MTSILTVIALVVHMHISEKTVYDDAVYREKILE